MILATIRFPCARLPHRRTYTRSRKWNKTNRMNTCYYGIVRFPHDCASARKQIERERKSQREKHLFGNLRFRLRWASYLGTHTHKQVGLGAIGCTFRPTIRACISRFHLAIQTEMMQVRQKMQWHSGWPDRVLGID